ncbi:MAG: carbamoyl-phosphate synthase large subunit [Gammaproteobacteria bacterium]|nr:carbamoyl-phosphate synthase large subunit [Gammaproteobacteria bacterium]
MPRRDDLRSILVIGSGPIVIGQGCEFDYSGTQAVKVLREQGYRTVLVNSNPATIMTDPEFADATYVEPITADILETIIARERPDALLPTLGGQTALNITMELARLGVLAKYSVQLIGAGLDAIEAAEDRGQFKTIMNSIGMSTAKSAYVKTLDEALEAVAELGYPAMVRPSFILGGGGTGIAHDEAEFRAIVAAGLDASPVGEAIVEEAIIGWKEYELEVMRDAHDNAVVVCSIENLDPMGVHTGDSVTVAPAMTLSDREYQEMRDDAIACLRAIGVETGGSNVQFAVDPATGRRIIVEMNPRVSRSSALASKATGFPIAKIATLLAVGYTLDEIRNDITGVTPASFEPVLDYVVVKVPRFDFAKFPSVPPALGTSMQSVGEAMAIGRTFPEALQKALRSLETGHAGLNADPAETQLLAAETQALLDRLTVPSPGRLFVVAELLRRGVEVDELADLTSIDPWFIDEIAGIVELRLELEAAEAEPALARVAKRAGFSDAQLAYLWGDDEQTARARLRDWDIAPTFKTVDTCAAEFAAQTPYFYGTYEEEDETPPPGDRTVIVLGSGPNRIGQGIEFDYCCVHASLALKDAGYETVMINCNPETVSTDYDTSDRLYFEPLTVEDVLAVIDKEKPHAVVVQLGGQTPLRLARPLQAAGVPIAGTSPDAIDVAEDRERFSDLCRKLGVPQPPHGTATSRAQAQDIADTVGFPVLVRPSYVLGGRAMRIVYTGDELSAYLDEFAGNSLGDETGFNEAPLLIDRFLEAATEVDLDAVFDGHELYIGGVMEHVEEAGVHSGDSACVLPPMTLSPEAHRRILDYTERLARGLDVCGLLNIQFAIKGADVFVLEANPRASRTVPFVSKATGVPLAKVASRVMLGETLADLRGIGLLPDRDDAAPTFVAVKEAVLPWPRFPAEDTILGPEMRATGEVMGLADSVGAAYAKALLGSGHMIPTDGTLFISLADRDKPTGLQVGRIFADLGFRILATHGTSEYLNRNGVAASHVDKVGDGPWDPVRLVEEGLISIVINTPRGRRARGDGGLIRRAATRNRVPCVTTIQGGLAVAQSLQSGLDAVTEVESLQQYHQRATR